ncbi:hypothetical protein [Aeoliella mucimassa]|uniref:Uncharacterized protein n=1 Tax=Aeoliella mucimassa TaxID=2527972 RepID=A0A518AM44_9BACT|nr:hypothetical protein [Aeoliella mucimassa]QDU55790.1 hypothetical protein Pan181_19860 [Aeoliella mucimassa]
MAKKKAQRPKLVDELDAALSLSDSFLNIELHLQAIAEDLRLLEGANSSNTLKFGLDGRVVDMASRFDDDQFDELADPDRLDLISSTSKYLAESVNSLYFEVRTANSVLAQLPSRVLELLDRHTGKTPWRAWLLRTVLDRLVEWPRENESISSKGILRIPTHPERMLQLSSESHPYELWDGYRATLFACRLDISALRFEFHSTHSPEEYSLPRMTVPREQVLSFLREYHTKESGEPWPATLSLEAIAHGSKASGATVSRLIKDVFGGKAQYDGMDGQRIMHMLKDYDGDGKSFGTSYIEGADTDKIA